MVSPLVAMPGKDDRMATRIAFSTHFPDRMKELAGEPTRFPEKLIAGMDIDQWIKGGYRWDMRDAGYNIQISNVSNVKHPKTTTIRSNYDYWKSKEGQLIQPFFWAGKPYRSKQVVFCPEVRLERVWRIHIDLKMNRITQLTERHDPRLLWWKPEDIVIFTEREGFDRPDHFWMWFNEDFDGAYLELESVEG